MYIYIYLHALIENMRQWIAFIFHYLSLLASIQLNITMCIGFYKLKIYF